MSQGLNDGGQMTQGNNNLGQNTRGQEEGKEQRPEDQIKEDIQKGLTKLKLENRKLQDLGLLSGIVWEGLVEIDLHKNYLSSIDILNQFRNLKFIKASDNYLQEVSLNLQKLEDLDLHNNYIYKFPLLHQLPRITNLNLNANKITDFRIEVKPPSCLSLQYLDLGSNKIQFEPTEFQPFIDRLKKFKNLKSLVLSNNPFSKEENKFDQIVKSLSNIEWFNNERAEEYRNKLLDNNDKDQGKKSKMKNQKKKPAIDKNEFQFPSLQLLCYHLEASNSHPNFAIDHLKDLASDVDKIIEHYELIDEWFAKDKNETEINEMIETFMQNSQLLIDNHYELQNIMLSILAKLSIIKFYEFGLKCFNTLKDLMIAGKEMEERVIEVLKKEVVNKLQQQNPEMISASLLQGLNELVEKTEKSEMLSGLFENCFPSWFRILLEKISACKKLAITYENNDHFDAIVALLASAVKDNESNVMKAIDKDLLQYISFILNESTWEQNRYINCLRIVENISKQSETAANKFIEQFVHNNLIKNIRNAMYIYKNVNDLKDEDSKDTDADVRLKYLTLAAEIDCLGGLLEADKTRREQIIKESLLDELLQIASHYKTDPVLLTSICKFAQQLFSREEIKANQHLLEPKVKRMQNLVQLTPYLGMKKFEDLLKMSKKYYDNATFAEKDKPTQISHLDDIVVQKLFIAIINLMNFFCEEAEKPHSSPIFEEVSQSLNGANREQALFNCLEVPNDEVKLAVVECLNNVPLSEFDNEEIATIIRLLGSYKNIGAGKTEFVLAKIFWILTKLTKEKEEKSGKDFRMKYGEKAIKEALDILIRNLQRQIDDHDEELEKLALSLSCLHFLKFTSINSELKRYMMSKHEQVKQALYADEMNTSYELSKYPIEIEATWLGRSIDVLMFSMTGPDSINPFNYVSFRVIQRMADILMNEFDTEVEDPFQPGIDVILHLKVHYRETLKKRKQVERTYWEDISVDFFNKLQKNQENFHLYSQQHYYFTSNNCIPIIRMFLTKKVPQFEHYLKKLYHEAYDRDPLILQNELKKHKKVYEEKEKKKQKEEEEKKGGQIFQVEEAEEEDQDQGLNILKMSLQQEELGQNYDPQKVHDHFSQNLKTEGVKSDMIKKRDYKTGVQNLKMRSLCISAYLRCLFASIEYAPNLQLKQEAIRLLKQDFVIKNITQLCDTTGWFEANIGAKYLRVMRHVIKVPYQEFSEPEAHLQFYGIISVVIKKILNLVYVKIKNEQQDPLTREDKILIFELATLCNIMCSQCALFKWSDVEVKQPGQHTRSRRSPQEKLMDKQLSMLFPSQSLQTFIAIIFRDMTLAYQVFETDKSKHQDDDDDDKSRDFINQKNELAREQIKLFLGEYLSKCKDNKYDVLEALMKGVVYEKRQLRDSFLQEILKSQQKASYREAIEHYMYERRFLIDPNEKERILHLEWTELAVDQQNFKARIFILTNRGIHIFKSPASKPCSVCSPENLCPDGPRPEHKFKYEQILELITFPEIPQKLALKLQLSTGLMKKSGSILISIIIPQHTSAQMIVQQLKEIMNFQKEEQDRLAYGSIMHSLGVKDNNWLSDSQLIQAKYVSYNASKSIFGFGGENLIQNCCLCATFISEDMTRKEIILLKENWPKWHFMDDLEKIDQVFSKENQDAASSLAQRQAEAKIKQAVQGMFTKVASINIKEISNLHVHKGKDPVVEISHKNIDSKITFLSDLCRQQFIEILISLKTNQYDPKDYFKKRNNDQYEDRD